MANSFTPPVRNTLPRTLPGNHFGNSLFRHFAPGAVGVNVFVLPGNVVTEDNPPNDVTPLLTLHGGHTHYVSAATKAILEAAGYTVTTVDDLVAYPEGGAPGVSPGLWNYGSGAYGGDLYGGFDTPDSSRDPNA